MKRKLTGTCVSFALFGAILLSQNTAEIFGTISDPAGAVVPNAAVQLKSLSTGATYSAIADRTGKYSFIGLPGGNYELSANSVLVLTRRSSGQSLQPKPEQYAQHANCRALMRPGKYPLTKTANTGCAMPFAIAAIAKNHTGKKAIRFPRHIPMADTIQTLSRTD